MVMTLSDFKRIEKLNQNVVLRCRVCGAVMQERKPCPVDALHLLQPYRINYTPYEKQKGGDALAEGVPEASQL
jgi:hypothetical protein